jgi:LEA14-like dessication related protein
MIKWIGYSLLGLSAGIGVWYGYQYYNMSKGGIMVKGVKARLEGGHVVLKIAIYNATSADVTINGAHIDVFLRGYNILDGEITSVTIIKGRSTTDIVLNIEPNWVTIGLTLFTEGSDLLDDLKNFDLSTLDLTAKGKVFITKGNIMIPFEQKLMKDA